MKAVDTNIVARFLMRDDPDQYPIARHILQQDVLLPVTVVLELGWLLTSRYRLPRAVVHDVLLGLVDLANVHLADEALVRWALARFGAGADLADMLHLVTARDAAAFLTFDRGISHYAGSGSPLPVEVLKTP